MHRADLKVGFACNNRCVFCAQGDKRARCASLKLPELIERLRKARPGAEGLVLTGGEPTLHRNILEIVKAAKLLGYRSVQLQTNGRILAYTDALRRLVEAGITEISPSIHGPDAETHDALTRTPGSWEESAAGIQNAVAAGLPVVTNSVIVRDNVPKLPALVEMLAGFGVRHAQLALVHPVGTALELFDEVAPRLSDLPVPLAAAREIALARGMRLVTEAVPRCFLRGMQDLAVEDHIPDTTVFDLDASLDYTSWRRDEGKAHGPPCERCTERARCEGPWREYPEHQGWAEYEPFREAAE